MDIINRDEIERRLARILGKDLRSELDRLLAYLGDPPRLTNVPNEYWQNGWRSIQMHVEPVLLDLFLRQAEGLMVGLSVGVDWDMVNVAASGWARQHLEGMLRQLFDRRYDHLNDVIPRFYEEGWNLGMLREDLEKWYSPVRAEMIAVTETTRAAVEGERAMVAQLEKETGIRMIPIWLTMNDERVCPVCGPRHEQPITDGKFPPAHPRCRCDVGYQLPEAT